MRFIRPHRSAYGYTLIELLVVVIIIGIMASLAIPRFMATTSNPKTAEARTILKQVFQMQVAYRQEFDVYWGNGISADASNPSNFAKIGVDIMASARYTFQIVADATSFTCTASANIDDDATVDTWTIDQTGELLNTVNDVTD